jgi:ADP-ribosylglycohydrolase
VRADIVSGTRSHRRRQRQQTAGKHRVEAAVSDQVQTLRRKRKASPGPAMTKQIQSLKQQIRWVESNIIGAGHGGACL